MTIKHSHFANGVDVSDNNGDFDWHSWDGQIDFAMIKATQSPTPAFPEGYNDTQFDRNWTATKALGLHRFAYCYFIPNRDPARDAARFVARVKERGLDSIDNFVIDFEEPAPAELEMPLHEQAMSAYVFCIEVQRLTGHSHRMLVYTFPSFADEGYCAMLGRFDLWIANWNVGAPDVPPPWSTFTGPTSGWKFWQFAAGRINGSPDLDRFHGSEHDLEVYCTR